MDKRADLHIHTNASDGALSPHQVVMAAAEASLAAIAITDHDTVDGIDEALNAGDETGVEVVPGIEISAIYGEKTEVHMLGYFIDHHYKPLLDQLHVLKNARFNRGVKIVEQLNAAGVPVVLERVLELAEGGAVGRPHVARAIVEIGAASSIDSAFGKYLVEGTPGYVERYKITPAEAMSLIRESGGVACCAHVAKLNRDELLVELIEDGLQAIEAYHPNHSGAASRFYRGFAKKRGLMVTGGSDAHCLNSDNSTSVGDVTVPYEVVEQLKIAAGK